MTGAEYIAKFLEINESKNIFLVTGGACAFIVDAIALNKKLNYFPMQHEQSAAMAADSLWKIDKTVGVAIATSGPGATNLITGIACSYFDSIPTLHIAGQVNQNEKVIYKGAKVRQAGFQETDIVSMVKPITKYAVQVTTAEELKYELAKAFKIAISGRMGPVLIDVPMDIQQLDVGEELILPEDVLLDEIAPFKEELKAKLLKFFEGSERPLVLFGAGVGLADQQKTLISWINDNNLPFVTSWNGMNFIDSSEPGYYGNIGVYGNRGANFILQSCDKLLVLGSRLDNRQRGNVQKFAPLSDILVLDIDEEELNKHKGDINYDTFLFDFRNSPEIFNNLQLNSHINKDWRTYCKSMKDIYFDKWPSSSSIKYNSLSPYDFVRKVNDLIKDDAIVTVDDGANLCWVYQAFNRTKQTIYTAGGNSPMGYSFPASIGASIHSPKSQVISFTGDGSIQMCMQELQTMSHHKLPIKLFILNNFGYGIIKQFQDTWFESRYAATGEGYSQPNFKLIAEAYNLKYVRIEKLEDLVIEDLDSSLGIVFDVILHPNTLIEPKIDSGNPLHNMFPYQDLETDSLELSYLKNLDN